MDKPDDPTAWSVTDATPSRHDPQASTEPPGRSGGDAPHLVDLHTHSTQSDGTLTPTALVRAAAERGLQVLSLTDHDTLSGIAEATAAAQLFGIEVVPGVEMSSSASDGNGNSSVHLLGYYVDYDNVDLRTELAAFALARQTRMERITERLNDLGLQILPDDVLKLVGSGTVGRPHIARALVNLEYVSDLREAFDRYLGRGAPAFVPRPKVETERCIQMIRRAGGVAVMAHPRDLERLDDLLDRLVPAGLGGIEVYYGEYDDPTRQELRRIADRCGLIATGGSDYHGPNFKVGRELGSPFVPLESVEQLRSAANRPASTSC